MENLLEIIMNTDEALINIVNNYGTTTYIILFLIIFCETGLVFFPFLPGDILLFSAGVIAASTGALNVWLLTGILIAAAVLGNTSNYFIGRYASNFFLKIKNATFQKYMRDSQLFYEEKGGMAIVFSRFVPILRTYVPFVAGISHMNAATYTTYNIIGGTAWILIFVVGGYLLGGIPWAKDNFHIIIMGIVILTLIPFLYKTVMMFRER